MRIVFFVMVYFSCYCLFGTTTNVQQVQSWTPSFQDSLRNKTYEELQSSFDKLNVYVTNDSLRAEVIANAYLYKAKIEKDTLEIANGYRLFVKALPYNYSKGLKYCDSIIKIKENGNFKQYPGKAYIYQGIIYNWTSKFDLALKSYINALKQFEKEKDTFYIIAAQSNIALEKDKLGRHKEALKTYLKNYNFLSKREDLDKYQDFYTPTLTKLSHSYNIEKKYDSSHYYSSKGILFCNTKRIDVFYPKLLLSHGTTSYLKGNYQIALDTLLKSVSLIPRNVNQIDEKFAHLYISKTLLKLQRNNEAIEHLEYIDSITDISNYHNHVREIFPLLIEHYKSIDDKVNQLRVMKKLIALDSISTSLKFDLINEITESYDTPQLIEDKNKLIEEIQNQNKKSSQKLIVLAALGMLTIFISFFFYHQKKRKQDLLSFEERIAHLTKSAYHNISKAKDLQLSPSLTEEILKKLDDFEDKNGFTENNITLAKLAKRFKTNSTYLSKIINTHKKKNFATYVNDLRIAYCTQRLKTDKKFRQYSIESIAKEVGFNSIQSFSSTFHKKIGSYPSSFIKDLENK